MSKNYEIDNVDLKILNLLMEDAKIPYTEVAKKVFVSGGTVHVRMKKLEEMDALEALQKHTGKEPRKQAEPVDIKLAPITNDDLMEAIKCTKGVSHAHLGKYGQWAKEFGSA